MKQGLYIMALFILCINNIYAQLQIDTIYYDNDWKGVSVPAFASYYRITTASHTPGFPNRYRDFHMDGTLQTDGCYIYIDKYDDAKSKFDGKNRSYYKSGGIENELSFRNGKLDGVQKHFYENGKLHMTATYDNGNLYGPYKEYSLEGKILTDGEYNLDGMLSGKIYSYNNGVLSESYTLVNGEIEGERIVYSNSGQPLGIFNIHKGMIHGTVIYFDDEGHISEKSEFKEGIPEGISTNYSSEGINTFVYKEVVNSKKDHIKITVAATKNTYRFPKDSDMEIKQSVRHMSEKREKKFIQWTLSYIAKTCLTTIKHII